MKVGKTNSTYSRAGRSGDQDNPLVPLHSRMRGFDRDLIRGKHYGQRSCEPRLKAEHMAAPTKSATRRFFLPTRSRPHMAQSGHPAAEFQCPLSEVKRTLDAHSGRTKYEGFGKADGCAARARSGGKRARHGGPA